MKGFQLILIILLVCVLQNGFAQGVWERFYAHEAGFNTCSAITVNSENGYTGTLWHNLNNMPQSILFKLDANGDLIFEENLQDSIFYKDLLEAPDGTYYILGFYYAESAFQQADGFVGKLDESYDLVWENRFVDTFETGLKLEFLDNGNLAAFYFDQQQPAIYSTYQELSTQGEVLANYTYPGIMFDRIEKLSNGNFFFFGTGHGPEDFILDTYKYGELNTSGEILWEVDFVFELYQGDYIADVVPTSDDHFIKLIINLHGGARIEKVNQNEDIIWSSNVDNFSFYDSPPLVISDANEIYIVGEDEILFYDAQGELLNRNDLVPEAIGASGSDVILDRGIIANGNGILAIGTHRIWPGIEVFLMQTDYWGNAYDNLIHGKVYYDEVNDCTFTEDDQGLENYYVELLSETGDTTYLRTDENGLFYQRVDTGQYQLTYYPNSNYWLPCVNDYTIDLDISGQQYEANIPLYPIEDCAFLTVDVSTGQLLAAIQNTYYVNYCNLGTLPIDTPVVELTLDPYMLVDSFSIPFSSQMDNTYYFDLESLDFQDCGSFKAYVRLDTDSIVAGQTHCVEAHIMPDTICDIDPLWSGASIVVDATCEGDSVAFRIVNEGTGSMIATLEYLIVEDHVILGSGNYELGIGEERIIKYLADGSTYWLNAQQEPGHPGDSNPNVWIEGCGAGNPGDFITGMATQFPDDDGNAATAIDCRENLASYDPNDKQVFPKGIEAPHYVEPGTSLEYQIRFQNTGTAPAFNVYILDTLSSFLNPLSVRPGSSSHDYDFSILQDGTLKFEFSGIMLPDSTSNPEESQGFVKFKVDMREDVPLESVIYNSAAIYFDFNLPIITNETWNTVGYYFVIPNEVSEETLNEYAVDIYPNPFIGQTNIGLGNFKEEALVTLFNTEGRLVYQQNANRNPFTLNVAHLPAGTYFYSIQGNGRMLSDGKLMIMK